MVLFVRNILVSHASLILYSRHPDKNPSPEANEHFMKINEAYETLTDEQKRKDYDDFGHTSAQGQPPQQRGDKSGLYNPV